MKKNATYSFLRGLLYLPVRFLFPTKVVGRENLPLPQKIITVSNHLSMMDIVIVAINVSGYRHVIGKKELTNSRFLAWLMRKVDAIPVDRGKTELATIRKVVSVLKDGGGITIFPEGTRNKTGESLQEVKAGSALFAIKGDAEVVTIMIYKKPRLFCKNYIYVGKPFRVAEPDARADAATVNEGALRIEHEMKMSADFLADYVKNKRWKEAGRNKKMRKKRQKLYARQAKRAKKALVKALREAL